MRNPALPYHAHLTLRSENTKTGPIPVSVTASDSCPPTCSFIGDGCYAEHGKVALHWRKVDTGERGMPWEMFCDAVATIKPGQLWRHNAAGDLPGAGGQIDHGALDMLLDANFGRHGFTYTHYKVLDNPDNAKAVAWANLRGMTVNLSADSIDEVDELADLGIAPVVCVLPSTAKSNVKTPAGRTVVVCPATQRDNVTCATCKLCYVQRDTVVGFPAHGSSFRRVDTRLLEKTPRRLAHN